MRNSLGDAEGAYNITRQVIPGEIEISPSNSSLIVHYQINVDVLDSQYNTVASRAKKKQIQITINGLNPTSDIEEIADSLCGQTDILPENRRTALIKALSELRGQVNRPLTTNIKSPSVDENLARHSATAPTSTVTPRSDSVPQFSNTMTRSEVDDLLHDSLQKIHWGNETECLQTLAALADIAQFDRNLTLIIQHEPLMNTLINGLKKYAASSLPACIRIITIFEKMSYFQSFHEKLARFKIGSMSLSLLHAQVVLTNVADQNLEKDKLNVYLKSQNQLLKLTVSLLFNLSENPSAMRKMVNKDIVTALVSLLERRNADLLIIALRFLRKIAIVPVNWSDIPYDQICPAIVQNIFRWGQSITEARSKHIIVLREGIELLYAFSYHPETMPEFKNSNVFDGLAKLVEIPELRGQMIRLFYKLSIAEGSDESFRNEKLLNMLIVSTTIDSEERLIALVVLMKLSMDKECAMTIAKSPVFTAESLKNMFTQSTSIQTNESKILLKMIRNVADTQPDLIKGFDNEIISACLSNANNNDVLCDIFAISSRAKMNSERAKFFTSHEGFVNLIIQILQNIQALPQLHLECIMFVSSVVLYSRPAQVLGQFKIVDLAVKIFMHHKDDLDIQTQCLFAFYRFVCHTDTRTALISHQEIVDAVIQHSASKNAVLNSIGNSVLDALVTFDKNYANRIKQPRFDAFNQEWLQAIGTTGNSK